MIELGAFRKKWSFLSEKDIYLACSGGVDSMVLLYLIRQLPAKPVLLHVNYMLRGKESMDDENFVREYALHEKLILETKIADLSGQKTGIQETARKIRHDWFSEKIQRKNTVLLLAHQEDDQLETFFLNLARKSGNSGLACMLEIHEKTLRPLLEFSKQEIYDFARKKGISWREDRSNASNKYTRNRLRNEILPFLEKEIPDLRTSVMHLIEVFQENKKEVDDSVKDLVSDIQKNKALTLDRWHLLTVEQRISILKSFAYLPSQLPKIEKLEHAQKGKSVFSSSHQIIREEDAFYFKMRNTSTQEVQFMTEMVKQLPANFTKHEIYLDASKIKGELILRRWKKGDRISPLGMEGSKLISDIITDAKIPNALREEVLVLCDDQTIHWCVGLTIGRLALADQDSAHILKCLISIN